MLGELTLNSARTSGAPSKAKRALAAASATPRGPTRLPCRCLFRTTEASAMRAPRMTTKALHMFVGRDVPGQCRLFGYDPAPRRLMEVIEEGIGSRRQGSDVDDRALPGWHHL